MDLNVIYSQGKTIRFFQGDPLYGRLHYQTILYVYTYRNLRRSNERTYQRF